MKTITPAERLQFAVQFAQLDLGALRPGDWLNLNDDFLEFFGVRRNDHVELLQVEGIPVSPRCFDPAMREEDTREDFEALQKEVRDILYRLVEPVQIGPLVLTSISHGTLSIRYVFQRVQEKNYFVAEGRTRDLFLLIVLDLLWHHPGRIQRCKECEMIFYRVQKQLYCTRACANRASVRNHRQREEVKVKEQERAHQRYIAKQPEGNQPRVK